MSSQNVTVAGAGVLGAQIAVQIACKGFNVCVYEVEEGLERAQDLLKHFHDVYAEKFAKKRENPELNWPGIFGDGKVSAEEIDALEARFNEGWAQLRVTTVPEEAFADSDFAIEAVPERTEIKIAFYKTIAPLLPEKTILLTNTSTLLPSTFAPYTGRPERYLAFHFLNVIWSANTLEIMPHPAGDDFPATDPKYVEAAYDFAKAIGMNPFVLKKEHAKHVYNTMLFAWHTAALELLLDDVADVETIDAIWSNGGRRKGPFGSMDTVGILTCHNCMCETPNAYVPGTLEYRAREFYEKMIEEGRLGYNAGIGFYDYRSK